MAVPMSAAVESLQGSVASAESHSSAIGPITLEVEQTGERSAGNPQLRSTWRGLETWHGRDSVTLANERPRNGENKLRPKPARQSSTYLR
jgi:hypothetical protein